MKFSFEVNDHDKELMVNELKKYFRDKYHAMIDKMKYTDVYQLWSLINGKV